MVDSTCGPMSAAMTSASPATCTPTRTLRYYPAVISLAQPPPATPEWAACASRSSRASRAVWKPPSASANLCADADGKHPMSDFHKLQTTIDSAFERRTELSPKNLPGQVDAAINECMELLDSGRARVAEVKDGRWVVNEWLKKAVLLYFRAHDNTVIDAGFTRFFDKVPLKYAGVSEADLHAGGARVVPHAIVRKGAYIAPNVVMMPSYVNIGAHVGSGTMVDTWATVGSGAQIGRNVHLAGGVGIGGVLEPPGARPVVVEDGCFIGSRCIITEGTLIEEGAVLGANVVLTASTPIIDVTGEESVTLRGRV